MPETATTHPLLETHRETLDAATQALRERSYYSRYPESPSPRVYGETAPQDGQAAHEERSPERSRNCFMHDFTP